MSRGLIDRLLDYFRTAPPKPAPPGSGSMSALPKGLRIYAIGDIHGFADLLARLADRIEADMRRDPPERALAVFLGDYIDRGPDSRGVLDRLARGDFPVPFEALRGNHEDLMLRALAGPEAMGDWCDGGGIETLQSYGLVAERGQTRKRLGKVRTALIDRLPASHRAFLEATRLSYAVGGYFFVHAGARPGVPLDRQADADLMNIRAACYQAPPGTFEKVLVHGHTPRRRPDNLPWRINVDTGAFKWGVLSGAVLEADGRRFLSTRD